MKSREKLVNIDPGMIKRIARMYETGLSVQEISEQLGMTVLTARRLLKLLGYSVE
jgi:DNA-binding IclR family transcriptional regulator